MSLLNLTNDGLPNVLTVIADWLSTHSEAVEESELITLIAPSPAVQEPKMVAQTLRRWIDLGLFERSGKRIAPLELGAKRSKLSDREFFQRLRTLVRKCVFKKSNNERLWEAEGARAADLTRSLAWLMMQDVYRTRVGPELEDLERKQIADQSLCFMQNDTRRNGLTKWASFLGFTAKPDRSEIDPTAAVRDAIAERWKAGARMTASEFIAGIAEDIPVLDTGVYFNEVEKRLDLHELPGRERLTASLALSRALKCLKTDGSLRLEPKADAKDSWVLSGRHGAIQESRFAEVIIGR
jgi:hypothetical protein